MPIERHRMPAVIYHYQYSRLRTSNDQNHGRSGFVHIHRFWGDWFRRRIEILESNPLVEGGGGPMTFNRSSLIRYLNAELGYFTKIPGQNQPPLPERLHRGWFGGVIGGSSDERIRDVYRQIFELYRPIDDQMHEYRSLNLVELLQVPVVENPDQAALENMPIACSKQYFNGAAEVSLLRAYDDKCHLGVHLKDPGVNIELLMDAIMADEEFFGVKEPILLIKIHVSSNEEGGTALDRIKLWQKAKLSLLPSQHIKLDYLKRADIVTADDALSRIDNRDDLLRKVVLAVFYPSIEECQAIIGTHHIGYYSEELFLPYSDSFISLILYDPNVNISALMSEVAERSLSTMMLTCTRIGRIDVTFHQNVFPDDQKRDVQTEAVKEQIRMWQQEVNFKD